MMNDLNVLARFYEDKFRHAYDGKYKVEMRDILTQNGYKTYIIELYPIANGRELLMKRIYDVGFGVDAVFITYLKASHFSASNELAHLYYSDPKTTPERIIELLDENMKEERRNAHGQ